MTNALPEHEEQYQRLKKKLEMYGFETEIRAKWLANYTRYQEHLEKMKE